jgi:hypothetical protein
MTLAEDSVQHQFLRSHQSGAPPNVQFARRPRFHRNTGKVGAPLDPVHRFKAGVAPGAQQREAFCQMPLLAPWPVRRS